VYLFDPEIQRRLREELSPANVVGRQLLLDTLHHLKEFLIRENPFVRIWKQAGEIVMER